MVLMLCFIDAGRYNKENVNRSDAYGRHREIL
ncbi:hypothetical protein A359_01980 [secondary endosymbiont of Ctenarytaina eucalypti]|uniref:Uncharacterized protein n=1 Tax=secondary endosymbiont of Ctenarytaina eucalypti TaxID=1199245 RepID=J3Z302_9ENTR|nr:hypothetical protein A359_01980 [secondary endosymbiont of Ctenarytaina eucalypti]